METVTVFISLQCSRSDGFFFKQKMLLFFLFLKKKNKQSKTCFGPHYNLLAQAILTSTQIVFFVQIAWMLILPGACASIIDWGR